MLALNFSSLYPPRPSNFLNVSCFPHVFLVLTKRIALLNTNMMLQVTQVSAAAAEPGQVYDKWDGGGCESAEGGGADERDL